MENQYYSHENILTTPATPGLLADALKKEYPEIIYATRSSWDWHIELLFQHGEKAF